mgnify:FL=1
MSVSLYYTHPELIRPRWVPEEHTELIRFPGGEWHVKGHGGLRGDRLAVVRGASADDLFGLAVWADAVHRAGGTPYAVIPYFPAARQDRTHVGESLSAKVYASFVNSMNLESVTVFDAHSPVILALLDRVIHVESTRYAHTALHDLGRIKGVIIPDAGAAKRSEAVAALLNVPTYQALKHRDPSTGQLSGFQVPALPEPEPGERYAIVDDIIDGGGTFMGLAQASGLRKDNLALYASHGIFSGRAHQLADWYGTIITTDSIDHTTHTESGLFGPEFLIRQTIPTIFPR